MSPYSQYDTAFKLQTDTAGPMKALPFIIIRGVNYNTYEKNAIFQVTKYQLWLTVMLALGAFTLSAVQGISSLDL